MQKRQRRIQLANTSKIMKNLNGRTWTRMKQSNPLGLVTRWRVNMTGHIIMQDSWHLDRLQSQLNSSSQETCWQPIRKHDLVWFWITLHHLMINTQWSISGVTEYQLERTCLSEGNIKAARLMSSTFQEDCSNLQETQITLIGPTMFQMRSRSSWQEVANLLSS